MRTIVNHKRQEEKGLKKENRMRKLLGEIDMESMI